MLVWFFFLFSEIFVRNKEMYILFIDFFLLSFVCINIVIILFNWYFNGFEWVIFNIYMNMIIKFKNWFRISIDMN